MVESKKIVEWKQKIIDEAVLAKEDTIFQNMMQINHYHNLIHQHVMDQVDRIERQRVHVPPFIYCWIEMGSGGREERTLWTDQDNGIIYDCKDESKPLVTHFLQKVSNQVVQQLADSGYPLCEGLVMASNPRWFQSIKGWKVNWRRWTADLTLEHLRYVLIVLDMRPMYGEDKWVDEFKHWAYQQIEQQIPRIVQYSLNHPLPLGIFGQLFTLRHGEYMGRFHLKEGGYYQLVSLVRSLSLHAKIIEPYSTRERILRLSENGYFTREEAKETEAALAFFVYIRLKHHLALQLKNTPLHDYLDLSIDRRLTEQLKTHLKTIKRQQRRWQKEFGMKRGDVL